MNASKISTIALWVLMIGSLVALLAFAFAEPEMVKPSSGTQDAIPVSTFLDGFIYWAYAVVGTALVLLVVFAIKTVLSDIKGAIGGIVGIALFVGLLVVCYFASPAQEFSRIVNGETEFFSEFWMKVIDMWCFSIYALIGVTVLLVVAFPVLRAIKVIK